MNELNAAGPTVADVAAAAVVPVIRYRATEEARHAAELAVEAGYTMVEITLTVPGAFELVAELATLHPGVTVGVGTVLNVGDAERCLESGARFVVSPCFVAGLVEACHAAGATAMVGSLTPTEVMTAWSAGADVVKVFPASSVGGPRYVKALKSVLPEVPLMPTGGVTLADVPDYLRAGAVAVGVGTELIDSRAVAEGRRADAVASARRYLAAARTV